MKKYSMIFAACAMVLFAACNKEEEKAYTVNGDMVTFNMGMDVIQNNDKQSYNGEQKRIFFTSDDQVIVNGTVCDVTPYPSHIVGSNSTWSNRAKVTVPMAANNQYDFYYPAAVYNDLSSSKVSFGYGSTFPEEVVMLNGAQRNDISTWTNGMVPVWPMYFRIPDLNNFSGIPEILNAVSFISPAITYGPAWCNEAFAPVTGAANFTNENCPTLYVTDVIVTSSENLAGDAYLNNSNPNNPKMVLYDNEATTIVCHAQGANQGEQGAAQVTATTGASSTSQEVINVLGIVPIPPMENLDSKSWQMQVYFHVDLIPEGETTPVTYYYVFTTNEVQQSDPLMRSKRNWLQVNFQTVGTGWPQQTADGINFANGTLLNPSTTPIPLPN